MTQTLSAAQPSRTTLRHAPSSRPHRARPRRAGPAALIAAIAVFFSPGGLAQAAPDIPAPLQAWHEQLAQSGFSGTVLIARAGAVVYQRSFGKADREQGRPFDAHTVFDIGSLTKQFVATAIVLLAERGALSLDDRLGRHLPQVPADKQAITVHQLLTHSAGLPAGLPGRALYDRVEAQALTAEILAQPLLAAPGERYHYANTGYALLAQIIERVSGQDWEAFIRQHLLVPAGLTETGYRLLQVPQARLAVNYGADPNWLQRQLGLKARSRSVGDSLQHLRQAPGRRWFEGAGGFLSTAQDMLAWSRVVGTGPMLSPAAWSRMFQPHVAENALGTAHYGYGWLVTQAADGSPRFSHNGSNGYSFASVDLYPARQLWVLVASNDIDQVPQPLMKALGPLLLDLRP